MRRAKRVRKAVELQQLRLARKREALQWLHDIAKTHDPGTLHR